MRHRVFKLAGLAVLALLLCQCQWLPKPPSPYASDVRLAFTPTSLASMGRQQDTIVVVAYYWGDPLPQHHETADGVARVIQGGKVDAVGRFILGEERYGWTIEARKVHLDGNFDRSLLPQIRGPVQMLVTAYSIQPNGASDDLIHCRTWIGTVKMAQERAPLIACEMNNNDKDSAEDLVAADDASSQ